MKKRCLYPPLLLISLLSILIVTPLFSFGPFQVQHLPTQFNFHRERGFDRIRASKFILQGTQGAPELPVKYLHYIIPSNMKVTSVRVLSRTQLQIPGSRYIYPAQPIVRLCSIPPWVDPDSTIYNSDSLYPNKLVEVSNSGICDGARLVTIAVYPLQYRPRTRRLFLTNNITFELELASAPTPERANIRGINGQKLYDAVLKSAVENDADIPLYYQPPQLIPEEPPEEQPPGHFFPSQYTIITTDELIPYFLPFANWLTDKGVPASVVQLSNVLRYWSGVDDAEKLRNYLIDAYKYYGTIWVLLGGDAGVMPLRYGWTSRNLNLPSRDIGPSDLYFSDLNGIWDRDEDGRWGEPHDDAVDIYPEIYVGRLLVRNPQEVNNWVNKILYYEQNGSSDLSLFTQTTWIYDSLYAGLGGLYPYPITRELFPNYFSHTNLNSKSAYTGVEALNVGAGLYQIYCHGATKVIATRGDPYWWKIHNYWDGPISSEHDGLQRLTNANRYYVVYSIGCFNAAYDGLYPLPSPDNDNYPTDTTIADAFTDTYEAAGAVAFLGNTRDGWYWASNDLHTVFCLSIFYREGYPELRYPQLGTAQAWSKVYTPSSYYYYYFLHHVHNLFGSPENEPWISYPGTMNVTHPTSIPVGKPVSFTVRVRTEGPLDQVKVCLNKLGDVYEIGWTNEKGEASFEICAQTEGIMKVTCTRPRSTVLYDYAQYLPCQTICRVEGKGTSGEQAQVSSLPKELTLSVSSPIVLSRNLKISYELPKNGRVKLSLHDITGRRIRELVNMVQPAGYYKNTMDLQKEQITSGVYFLVLELDSDKRFKKITFIK